MKKSLCVSAFLGCCLFSSFAACSPKMNPSKESAPEYDTVCYRSSCSGMDEGNRTPSFADEILIFVTSGHDSRCYYYGSSAAFNDSPDVPFPGFLTLQAQDVHISGNSVSFVLDSNGQHFYSQPVEIGLRGDADIMSAGYQRWVQPEDEFWHQAKFTGKLKGDSLVLNNSFIDSAFNSSRPLVFVKEDYQQVKRHYLRSLVSAKDVKENSLGTAFE